MDCEGSDDRDVLDDSAVDCEGSDDRVVLDDSAVEIDTTKRIYRTEASMALEESLGAANFKWKKVDADGSLMKEVKQKAKMAYASHSSKAVASEMVENMTLAEVAVIKSQDEIDTADGLLKQLLDEMKLAGQIDEQDLLDVQKDVQEAMRITNSVMAETSKTKDQCITMLEHQKRTMKAIDCFLYALKQTLNKVRKTHPHADFSEVDKIVGDFENTLPKKF